MSDFDAHRLSRLTDPETSSIAAEDIAVKLRRLQGEVYGFFRARKRATLRDVENYFSTPGSTHRARVPELVDMGLLRAAINSEGNKLKMYQDGGWRIVWELNERPGETRAPALSATPPLE